MKTTRREFLKLGVGVGALTLMPGMPVKAEPKPDPLGEWLECDGSSFYAEELPELYAQIGDQYGADPTIDDGVTFRLPDFRVRLEARSIDRHFVNSPMDAQAVDGLTGQPTNRAIRYLIKARKGDETMGSVIPIGTIIASL